MSLTPKKHESEKDLVESHSAESAKQSEQKPETTKSFKIRFRKLLPTFGISSLFMLVSLAGVFFAMVQSHQQVRIQIELANEEILAATKEVREEIYAEAAAEYQRKHGDNENWNNANVKNRRNFYKYLQDSVREESRSQFRFGGIWEGESKSVYRVNVFGRPDPSQASPSPERGLLGLFRSVFPKAKSNFGSSKVDAVVRCKSPWYVFAGSVRCEVELNEAPFNDAFIDLLSQRLADLDIQVSVNE